MAIPNNITEEDILKAIEEIDRLGVESVKQSTKYELLYKENRYPPKEVLRFANEIRNGYELIHFGGGYESNNFLSKRGFTIVYKGTDQQVTKHGAKISNLEQLVGNSSVFTNHNDAVWAFNFIHDMLTRLDVSAPGDERLSVTYRKNRKAIHVNFCSWLVLGFYYDREIGTTVNLTLTQTDEITNLNPDHTFSRKGMDRKVSSYVFPINDVKSLSSTIKENYLETLSYIRVLFKNHVRSSYRVYNNEQLEAAIFNHDDREEILNNGINLLNVEGEEKVRYYWLTANPSIWDVSRIKNGETVFYTAYNEKGNKRRVFNAFESAQPKDKILFYESTPRKEIVALGEVVEGLHVETEEGFPEPVEGVSFRYIRDVKAITWSQIINVEELKDASPVKNGAQGSLFELTENEFEAILALEETELMEEEEELPHVDFSLPIEIKGLHFEDKQLIIKQVQTALRNGKNIILTGPPGTGKSKLAKEICRSFGVDFQMTTATSDWSTYETIGGYRPEVDGTLSFKSGLFLSCFKNKVTHQQKNKWLIIDEMNRADIDKAFGSLFSALTGDDIVLPFNTDNGTPIVIRSEREEETFIKNDNEYIIPNDWRLIGTMNTFDKASLYEMSYAFMRRFAFIPVGVPKNITNELVSSYLTYWHIETYRFLDSLVQTWKLINEIRQIGPAIVEDLAKFTQEDGDFTSAIILYVMPQFEGLMDHEIIDFINKVGEIKEVDRQQLITFAFDFFQIKE
ncbi:hypothetical protein BC6307_07215 [Sutcliffiella cohnii]|uniref:AAA+ ATPase domain-containing protein n=1 Tax=Sutcliffiella cohnii TaxID=33932 RepID=A0A223KNL9_9BACI|nr:AAA family ATPase [Sutcliffiella cohnii]AST91081.1 hypothetical protein BC6307_07215 [Sutcliffiella cohnii]